MTESSEDLLNVVDSILNQSMSDVELKAIIEKYKLSKQNKKTKSKESSNRFKFTKDSFKKIKPTDKTVTYHDTETTGLKLTVSKTGTYTFMIYRKIQGRPERIKLGNYPAMTVEQAKIAGALVNAQIAIKNNPNDTRRAELSEATLGELFADYIELHSKPHKKSWRNDVMNYKNHLSHWDNRKLSHIKNIDIKRLHNKINKKSGGYQANRVHSLIRSMFYKAMEWELYNEVVNPAKGIKRFKEDSRERKLETDELQAFFKSVSEEENETIRDYVLISLLTGARRANVLSMEWKELHLERAEWLIPKNKTKNGKQHTLPLTNEALQILKERKKTKTNKFVFSGTGKSGHLIEPKKGWIRILKRAGIEDLRLHDLRRSLGSWQAKTGASLAIIGETLAHKDQKTTAIYARLDNEPVRESMEKATSAMMNAGKQKAKVVSIKKKV